MIKKEVLTQKLEDLQDFADEDIGIPLAVKDYDKKRLLILKQTSDTEFNIYVKLATVRNDIKKNRHDYLPFGMDISQLDSDDQIGIAILCNIFDSFTTDDELTTYIQMLGIEEKAPTIHSDTVIESMANGFYILRQLLQDNIFREESDETSFLVPIVDQLGTQMDEKDVQNAQNRLRLLADTMSYVTGEGDGEPNQNIADILSLEQLMMQNSDTGVAYLHVFISLFRTMCDIFEIDSRYVDRWFEAGFDHDLDSQVHDEDEPTYHLMLNLWHGLVEASLPNEVRKRVK